MQIFEFHFNPKTKPDLIFNGFCFEPQNIYEKRVGGLYMAGVLKNTLPQNLHLLDHLSQTIKQQYYKNSLKNPAKALQEGLKLGNAFLENISKKGDVSWLGHLDFAVLSLKSLELNFTKTGEIKIFLLRGGQVIDIDKRLKFEELEPYPLKIFGNIISGKLAEDDILLILTEELMAPFQKLLTEIAALSPFNEKSLKEIFTRKEEILSKISGLCLLISLTRDARPRKKEMILGSRPRKEFAFKNIFGPALKKLILRRFSGLMLKKIEALKKLYFGFTQHFQFKMPAFKLPRLPSFTKPRNSGTKVKMRTKSSSPKPAIRFPKGKNITLIFILILILGVGFIFSKIEEGAQSKLHQATFLQIQQKVSKAEGYLVLKDNPLLMEKADSLLQESRDDILNLIKVYSQTPQSFKNQVMKLENKISDNLFELNKLTEIPDPELVFEVNPRDFVPQKIISNNNSIYLFSPYAPDIFKINENKESAILPVNKEISFAAASDDALFFFSKSGGFTVLKDGQLQETTLPALPDFAYNDFSSYQSNLYFLDENQGQIIKYSYLGNSNWSPPQIWLNSFTQKSIGAKSITVTGSAWVLNQDNSVARYYAREFQENIEPNIFPAPKDFSKILAVPGLAYLYFLEPQQKRVIITDRTGGIIRQFQSDKFNNLLDFSVSKDGKTIYLLNGLKIYKINLPL